MITVCIATAVSLFREGLQHVLTDERGVHVTMTARRGDEVLRSCHGGQPEVLLLDVTLPGPSTSALLRRLRQRGCGAAVVLFGVISQAHIASLKGLGPAGLLHMEDDVEEFVRAIHFAAEGDTFVSTRLERQDRMQAESATRDARIAELLTPTELQILRALVRNRTSREIAEEMYISYRTVQKHRANMARKLGLEGSNALLSFALQHRWVAD